jgi:hypothetical protein
MLHEIFLQACFGQILHGNASPIDDAVGELVDRLRDRRTVCGCRVEGRRRYPLPEGSRRQVARVRPYGTNFAAWANAAGWKDGAAAAGCGGTPHVAP